MIACTNKKKFSPLKHVFFYTSYKVITDATICLVEAEENQNSNNTIISNVTKSLSISWPHRQCYVIITTPTLHLDVKSLNHFNRHKNSSSGKRDKKGGKCTLTKSLAKSTPEFVLFVKSCVFFPEPMFIPGAFCSLS